MKDNLLRGVGIGVVGAPIVEGVARAQCRGKSLALTIWLDVDLMLDQLADEAAADEAASTPEGETLA